MKITELSERTGVATATIKFYAREGLLPPGERTRSNQTEYSEQHVTRLRLIRALIEEADLSIAEVKRATAAIDDRSLPLTRLLGAAQQAVSWPGSRPSDASLARVRASVEAQGWVVNDANPGLHRCAAVLDRLAELDRDDLSGMIESFAAHAAAIAEHDIDLLAARQAGRDRLAETVVIGGFLGDTIISGLRQMAQESIARHRYAPASIPPK